MHGSYNLNVHAPGHVGQAQGITIDSSQVDLGDETLEPSALLRVRPRLNNAPWRGPLPRPIVHDAATGERLEPQPTSTVVDGILVLDGLPIGRLELRINSDDDLLGEAVPVRLLPGPAIQVDWPLRIGRELTLRFPAPKKVRTGQWVNVKIRDQNDTIVLERELTVDTSGAGLLEHVFAPGNYIVEAKWRDGPAWRWPLDTARWRNGITIEIEPPQ